MPTTPVTPSAAPADPATADAAGGSCCGDPHDPHDHAGHDHGPTGAEIATGLVRGFSVISLVVPFLAVVLLLASLAAAPSTPLVLLIGIILGGLQLGVLVATGLVVARGDRRLSVHPGLVVARSLLEEVLRVAAVLIALVLWPAEARGPMGLWVGVGCALVWAALATAQLVSARRRIARPSDWSREMVATLLLEKVGVRRTMVMRVLDVVALMLFQVGATVLIMAAPVMVVATVVLSVATGLSTLVLLGRSPSERVRSPWALAPLGVGALAVVLAAVASAAV